MGAQTTYILVLILKHPANEAFLSYIFWWRKSLEAGKWFSQGSTRKARIWIQLCWASHLLSFHDITLCPHNHLLNWTESKGFPCEDPLFVLISYVNGKGLFLIFDSEEKSLTLSLESRPACCTKLACGLDGSFWNPITLHPGNGIVYHKNPTKAAANIALWPFMFLEIHFLAR